MKNVITRSLTGIVYIAVIVGCVLWGNYGMTLLCLVFGWGAIVELQRIILGREISQWPQACDVVALLMLIHIGSDEKIIPGIAIVILALMARFIIPLYIKKGDQIKSLGVSCLGLVYIGIPMMLLMNIYTKSAALVMLMFIMIWLSDTGAFCVGSLIGRHKLFERISPKKSWEGFFGGLAFAIAAGVAAWAFTGERFFPGFECWQLGLLGAIVGIFATWGDLIESMIKRTLGIKDSGHILPGHGGILDRIDSLLLVAPATFVYITILSII